MQFEKTIHELTKQLATDGLIAFSLPIEGTFVELPPESRNHFFSLAKLKTFLSKAGLQMLSVSENTYLLHFDSMLDAIKSIKATGASYVVNNQMISSSKSMLLAKQPTTLTYCIGFLIAEKQAYVT
jgi:malonyl-CoA O-methyltransferase